MIHDEVARVFSRAKEKFAWVPVWTVDAGFIFCRTYWRIDGFRFGCFPRARKYDCTGILIND